MAKIQFDIKYKPQIESGEYKVETESGAPAKILDWEWNNEHTGVCLAVKITEKGKDTGCLYTEYGKRAGLFPYEKDSDLFIVTPEEEMTEFDDCVLRLIDMAHSLGKDHPYNTDKGALLEHYSAELRKLARNEIVKSGYAIVESEHYLEEGRKNYERGKAEALKDLPRWRKDFEFMGVRDPEIVGPWLCYKKNRIVITDLEKLPGFKED